MTPADPLTRPGRLAAVLGAPPADDLGTGALGPDGIWPPPGRPGAQARGDPPTAPLPTTAAFPDTAVPHTAVPHTAVPDSGQAHGSGAPPAAKTAVLPDLLLQHGAVSEANGRTPPHSLPPELETGGRIGAALRRVAPAGWRGARVDPGRPGATALALVAAAAAVVAAVGVWFEYPRAAPVADLPAVTVVAEPGARAGPPAPPVEGSIPTASAPAPPPAVLVVSVSGKVHRPGLVEVPDGARVADVLEAAGGALPGTDLAGINLARRVTDGEQVAVGVPPAPDAGPGGAQGAAPGAGSPGAAGSGAPAGKVDLNSATLAQLDTLPGVGPVTAQRILEWRTQHGRFSKVEQLREIEGIGERRFAQLREVVTV